MLKKLEPYILLAPALFIMLCVFASGLAMGLLQSLGHFSALGLREITLRYYLEVFSDGAFKDALGFSLYTSLISSLTALLLGVVLAYALMRSPSQRMVEQLLYKLPIVVPHAVAAFLVFSVLGQSGWLSRVAFQLGWISDIGDFPVLLFDQSGVGVILAYVWKEIPFVALVVFGVLKSADAGYSQVARNLGASRLQSFIYVTLPLCLPTLLTTFIIIFAYSFGAFEIPYLLGPTTPKALPVLAYIAYINPDLAQRPYAMAINMVIAALTFLLVLLYSKSYTLLKRISPEKGDGSR